MVERGHHTADPAPALRDGHDLQVPRQIETPCREGRMLHGEQQPSARRQHAVELGEHRVPVAHVLQCQPAHDAVEARVRRERERPRQVVHPHVRRAAQAGAGVAHHLRALVDGRRAGAADDQLLRIPARRAPRVQHARAADVRQHRHHRGAFVQRVVRRVVHPRGVRAGDGIVGERRRGRIHGMIEWVEGWRCRCQTDRRAARFHWPVNCYAINENS